MERARPYLKVAALLSTVALVGAFVAYHAGAFAQPPAPEAPAEPQPTTGPQPSAESPAPPLDPHPAFMYGSKSAPAFLPVEPVQAPGSGPVPVTPISPDKSPTFLGGSKSMIFSTPGKPPSSLVPVNPPPVPPNVPKP